MPEIGRSGKNDIAASRFSELAKVLETSADYLLTGAELQKKVFMK